jgi:hypothetical protein
VRAESAKSWLFKPPAMPASLSLSAHGSLLGMVSNPSNGSLSSSPQFNSAWVLATDSRPGQLGQHYHQVVGRATSPLAEELSPSGAIMTVAIPRYSPHKRLDWQVTLRTASTAIARLTGTVNVLPAQRMLNEDLAFSPDASGRYLLLSEWDSRIQRIDLATGRISTLPRFGTPHPAGIGW